MVLTGIASGENLMPFYSTVPLGQSVITGGNKWPAKPNGEDRGACKHGGEVRGRRTQDLLVKG